MSFINAFKSLDWSVLIPYIIKAAVLLPCLTLHELAHGYTAYKLGDFTAKERGRLTLNPLKHIDGLGFLMMLFLGFGWAKPVPVNMRYFKHPKRDMAMTALAGPVANILIAIAAMFVCRLLYPNVTTVYGFYAVLVFALIATSSVYLGLFNLIPIPPLDGSRILFAFLPDRIYYVLLKYEKYSMLLLIVLVNIGIFYGGLSSAAEFVIRQLSALTGFPNELLSILV